MHMGLSFKSMFKVPIKVKVTRVLANCIDTLMRDAETCKKSNALRHVAHYNKKLIRVGFHGVVHEHSKQHCNM